MSAEQLAQRTADREAIEARMWAYDRSLDNYDADAYAANFTEDGGFGRVLGHEALRAMITSLVTGQEQRRAAGTTIGKMHHFTMNPWLEFTGPDTARFHYYHQTVFGTGGQAGTASPPVMAAAGQGIDDLVRVNGQWLIRMRNVAPTREQE
jgi:SnoaL-like domain